MKTYSLAHGLKLTDVAPPISGFKELTSAYVLKTRKVALLDVGPSAFVENLMSGLVGIKYKSHRYKLYFATHIHTDHAGSIGKAIEQMPNAMVLVHERGRPHLVKPARLWEDSQ